jgi:hypothetical protein
MKTLTILIAFTVMFSSPSFAGWTKVNEGMSGDTFYVDFERIRKHDGYVYWWGLKDLLEPDKTGDLSYKRYDQGDCKLFRYKGLSASFHKEPMGGGTGRSYSPKNPAWDYPSSGSVGEYTLKSVCAYVK